VFRLDGKCRGGSGLQLSTGSLVACTRKGGEGETKLQASWTKLVTKQESRLP
jgi:hypothetical protein